MIPRILAIAGSDSGGGAGIQADIKTITMLGGHAMTAITAITAQNTLGVAQILPVPSDMVLAQIHAVVSDLGVDAIKIGMISSADTALTIREALTAVRRVPVVLDPVMVATSGAVLADEAAIAAFAQLISLATLVTPNAPELAALVGVAVENHDSLKAAAAALADRYGVAVLAKGGHLPGDMLTDMLVEPGGKLTSWQDMRIDTRHSHGTGCTLSSAIATGLAGGLALVDAITRSRAFVRAALVAAPGLGAGHGPMGHALGRTFF